MSILWTGLHNTIEWVSRVAALLSQAVNVLFLFGHHDQTVSARAYVNRHRPIWRLVYKTINRLFWFQDDHCRLSHQGDIEWAREVLNSE